jgi:hypothetical protein
MTIPNTIVLNANPTISCVNLCNDANAIVAYDNIL